MNRLVKKLHAVPSDAGAARMSVENHRVTSRHHGYSVAGQSRERMCHGGHCSNDAEGSIFRQRETVFAAASIGPQELNAGCSLAGDDQLLDLVLEPADLSFVHFFPTQRLRLIDANAADAVHGF